MKTAALWGLRARNRLMHDGLTFTYLEAINRHAGHAQNVTAKFNALPGKLKAQLLQFLGSL